MFKIFHESRNKIVNVLVQVENIVSITRDLACLINQHFDFNKKNISWRRIDRFCDQLLTENESNRSRLQLANFSITISPYHQIIKRVEHIYKKACSETNLMKIETSNVLHLRTTGWLKSNVVTLVF
jgi:hypothetical protein